MESGLWIYFISFFQGIAKLNVVGNSFFSSQTRNEVKGFNSYWAYVTFPPISCLEMDTHPVSVATSSPGRLTYAFCSTAEIDAESQVVNIGCRWSVVGFRLQ